MRSEGSCTGEEGRTHQSPVVVAQAYFAAVNEARLTDLGDLFFDDACLTFPQLEPIHGRGQIREFYKNVLQSYPEHRDIVRRYFTGGSGDVAAEIRFDGKTSTGRLVGFDAVDLFRIRDGKICELKIFYDSAKVMQMIGALPK